MATFKRARNTGKASVIGIRSYEKFPTNPFNEMQIQLIKQDGDKRPGLYKFVNGSWIPSGKAKTAIDDHLENVNSDVQAQINSKLDKTGKAVDSDKLDGMDSSHFGIRARRNEWLDLSRFKSKSSPATPIELVRIEEDASNTNMAFNLNNKLSYFGIDANNQLRFGNVPDLNSQGQLVYHSGNANSTLVDWKMQDAQVYRNLTVNGATTLNNLSIQGDLTVQGKTTFVNTEELKIADNIFTLNSDVTGTPTENAGLEVERGTQDNVSLIWNESLKKWQLTVDGKTFKNIAVQGEIARTNWNAIEGKPTTIEGYNIANAAHKVHTHTKNEVGLPNVDNTSDINKPVSTAQKAALDKKSDKGHTHTKAQCGLDKVDNTADLDKPVSKATQDKLNLKSDKTHNHDIVYSKLGHTHSKSQVGLPNVDNTSDINKPVSKAQQAALDTKSDKTHNHDAVYSKLGHTHTKAQVGLPNVDNTADIDKPISKAQKIALDTKADKGHKHTKSEIGLDRVNNTNDLEKPISTATQNALNQKSDRTHSHTTESIGAPNINKVNTFKENQTFNKDVLIRGNLSVEGTVTSIHSEQVTIADNIIVLNSNVAGTPTEDGGIEVERGTAKNVSLIWDESSKHWSLTKDGTNYKKILVDGDIDYRWQAIAEKPTTLSGFGITDAASKVHTHTKSQVGLPNVDNTSDMAKPISTAQKAALDNKSDKGHNHDDRYYLKGYIDTELGKKSNNGHTHPYLPLTGGTISNNLAVNGKLITGRIEKISSIEIQADSDCASSYEYLGLYSGKNQLKVHSDGKGLQYNGKPVYHEGNLDISKLGGALENHNHDTVYLKKTEKAADSDRLDGLNSSQFGRRDAANTFTEKQVFNKDVEVKQVLNVGGSKVYKSDGCLVFEV